jgi:hypothetical protein
VSRSKSFDGIEVSSSASKVYHPGRQYARLGGECAGACEDPERQDQCDRCVSSHLCIVVTNYGLLAILSKLQIEGSAFNSALQPREHIRFMITKLRIWARRRGSHAPTPGELWPAATPVTGPLPAIRAAEVALLAVSDGCVPGWFEVARPIRQYTAGA